jgi:small conductance mechanosensitive channel
VRDFDGTVWYVTNGSVTELGNLSQGWSVAVIDVPIAHGADLEHAKTVLRETVEQLQADEAWTDRVMPDSPVVGVEVITATAITIRTRVHAVHGQQWAVARELRARSIMALEQAGVPMPFSGPGTEPAQ